MFSGIVENIGVVVRVTEKANLATIQISCGACATGVKPGDSISVDGVCLTVAQKKNKNLVFDVMKESLDKTGIGSLKLKSKVNLERALKANGRINGHFVTGHIDGQGTIKRVIRRKNYCEFYVKTSKPLMRYIAAKGSICVDGVSLTVGNVGKNYFSFYLIPYTHTMTTLGNKKAGQKVNLETDILAKYILK